jgi:hypothetical protein
MKIETLTPDTSAAPRFEEEDRHRQVRRKVAHTNPYSERSNKPWRRQGRRDFGSIKADGPRFSATWWEGNRQRRKRGFASRTKAEAFLAKVRIDLETGERAGRRSGRRRWRDRRARDRGVREAPGGEGPQTAADRGSGVPPQGVLS